MTPLLTQRKSTPCSTAETQGYRRVSQGEEQENMGFMQMTLVLAKK